MVWFSLYMMEYLDYQEMYFQYKADKLASFIKKIDKKDVKISASVMYNLMLNNNSLKECYLEYKKKRKKKRK